MTDSNYINWEKQFDNQVTVSVNVAKKIFFEACDLLFYEIRDRTPLGDPSLWKWPAHSDYIPGKLKAGWTNTRGEDYVLIINAVPYAYRVEYGSWSTQAPEGMMRVSIMQFPHIIDITRNKYRSR